MQKLSEFFQPPFTSLGVFYPKDHALISFRSFAVAQTAAETLVRNGLPHVRFIPAGELLNFLDDLESTASGMLGMALSRLTDTEGANALLDAERAKDGAGFVAVRCADREEALRVLEIIRPLEPMALDYYVSGGVESMVSSAEPAAVVEENLQAPFLDPFRRDAIH